MITEDYVSFETAKLLKEKGFKELTYACFTIDCDDLYGYRAVGHDIMRPTLQMAMKWLREVYNIFIGVNTVISSDKTWGYEVFIQKQEVPIPSKLQWDWFNTYEEGCEAAIQYCLKNLI